MVLVDIKEDNLAKPFLTLFGLEESEDAVVSFLMTIHPVFLHCIVIYLILLRQHLFYLYL